MSDYDDYDNLYFEPIGDMSKLNDCNDGKRGSDVLVSAVDKCKDLEEKLAHSEKMRDLQAEYVCKLEEKLRTVEKDIKWIEEQSDTKHQDDYDPEAILKNIVLTCNETLNKIKE